MVGRRCQRDCRWPSPHRPRQNLAHQLEHSADQGVITFTPQKADFANIAKLDVRAVQHDPGNPSIVLSSSHYRITQFNPMASVLITCYDWLDEDTKILS